MIPTVNYFKPSNYYAGVHSQVFPNAPVGLLFDGDAGVPPYLGFTTSLRPIMPRVGFAYDVFGNGKTSIRGGAGMFYDTREGADLYFTVAQGNAPYFPTYTLVTPAGPFNNPYQGITSPFPLPPVIPKNTTFALPVTVQTVDGSHIVGVVPVVSNWNLTIEQQIASGWIFRVAYVGNHGSHLRDQDDINPAVYIPGSTLSTTARRMFQGYGTIRETMFDCNSIYHGLQMTLEKRFTQGSFLHGLRLVANYTYSKVIDDVPYGAGVENTAEGSAVPFWFPNRHQMDTGPSDFDHTNVAVISYEYSLPRLKGANKYARGFLGDWEFNGILTGDSGDPLTILSGVDNSKTGLGEDRAVVVGPAKGPGACGTAAPCVNYFNPNSFNLNAVGTYGNAGKGAYYGPNLIDWDMGLFKNFSLSEHFKLQFRAEFFNILNRANFLDPTTSVSAAGFGSIKSANDPRIMQFALKLNF